MLLSVEWWATVGGLSEDFFLYIEETDYAVRLSKVGGTTFVALRATAWQEPGRFPRYLAIRNRTLFLRRNFGSFALTIWLLENVIGVVWSARRPNGWWDRTTERGLAVRHGFTGELTRVRC
jgi:GT2 family glycosyltransferase